MKVMQAMDDINHKIEKFSHPISESAFAPPPHEHEIHGHGHEHEHKNANKDAKNRAAGASRSGNRDVDGLTGKLDDLEVGGKNLKKQLDGIRLDFEGLTSRLRKSVVSSDLPRYDWL